MDIVGVDHTESVDRIKERIPSEEYERLFHEDFRNIEDLELLLFLRNIVLTPIYAFSFFFLIPLRVVRRRIGGNRKSDFTFRHESSISEKTSIDAHPAKVVEMHEPTNKEIAFNWAPVFLVLLGTYSLVQLGLTLDLVIQNLQIYAPLTAAFLVIFLSQIVLSWFLSLEERDQYMIGQIVENTSSDRNGLVLVGDAHAPGIYSELSEKLDEEINMYRIDA
jgi:hypothetical protein